MLHLPSANLFTASLGACVVLYKATVFATVCMLLFHNRVDNVYTLVMSMAVVLVVPSLSGCMVAFPIPIGYHMLLSSLLKTEHQKGQHKEDNNLLFICCKIYNIACNTLAG